MHRHLARAAAAVAACLATTAALAPAARADTRTFTDKGAHLTTVEVAHTKSKVRVVADVGPFGVGDHVTFWLDTDAGNSGPEYKAEVHPNSDGLQLLRVGSFSSTGKPVDCDGFRATSDVWGPQEVTITVPRSCIGKPAAVRVAVRAAYEVTGPDVIDWGPGTKKFFGWVAR
ncbi:hypothetical protein SAMN04488543_1114 [Friedmanniella luteola]|uniref:Uncharacterized protein n=1 Tax=Friedmanniella luteola TaxID=546871 RepID=A0A1H1PL91_9ACTN|nr:hypothetical protein [Friedmanniella luteola]SDS12031.1 hypothetical protein SAMN04488543_1114 [Friedmanniella luteola]